MSAAVVSTRFEYGRRHPLKGGGFVQFDKWADCGSIVTIWAPGAGVGEAEKMDQFMISSAKPPGWMVVPPDITPEMRIAFNGYAQCAGYIEEGYRAMLAAVPET